MRRRIITNLSVLHLPHHANAARSPQSLCCWYPRLWLGFKALNRHISLQYPSACTPITTTMAIRLYFDQPVCNRRIRLAQCLTSHNLPLLGLCYHIAETASLSDSPLPFSHTFRRIFARNFLFRFLTLMKSDIDGPGKDMSSVRL